MSCGVGHRHGSDLALPWLWHRPEATALIGPLGWEPPYATAVALKRQKKKKETKEEKKRFCRDLGMILNTKLLIYSKIKLYTDQNSCVGVIKFPFL